MVITDTLKKLIPFLLLLFIGAVNPSFGQNTFHGRVKDISTGEGIINATIIYVEGKGVISDIKGEFKIEDPVYPMKLEISHLNYESQSLIVGSMYESGLTIQLQSKKVDIEQVEILGERIIRLFEKKHFYIIDYSFLNNNILMIGYDHNQLNKGQLLLTDLMQDTLFKMPLRKPKSLYKDAFGNIHVFAGDYVCQVFWNNNKLELMYPTLESQFLSVLQLQSADDHRFIFKDTKGDGQLHTYYRIDTVTKNIDTLIQVFDHQLFYNNNIAERHKKRQLPKLTIDYHGQMDTTIAAVKAANRLFQATYFDNYVIHKPITSQLFKCENEYLILDLANAELNAFTKDSLKKRTLPLIIPFHTQRIKYFIQDEVTMKIYWVYYHESKALLGELDINTGKIINQIETPSLPFIENIKIRDGEIWFLYQSRLGETVKSLYRMR